MKNKFLSISIGISMMIFSTAFLFRSMNSANAIPPSPKEFIEEGTNKIGKFMMTMTNERDNYGDNLRVLIWDSETGKSNVYMKDGSAAQFKELNFQLPENPLGN
jgi:hypothetical protein